VNNNDRKPDEDLERRERGPHEKFLAALAAVPDVALIPAMNSLRATKANPGKDAD